MCYKCSLDKCGELGILVDAGTRLPDMQALLRANYETNARRLQAEADAAVEAIASRSKAGDIGGALLAATEAAEQYPWHGQLRALRDELEAKPLPPPSYVPASGATEAPTTPPEEPADEDFRVRANSLDGTEEVTELADAAMLNAMSGLEAPTPGQVTALSQSRSKDFRLQQIARGDAALREQIEQGASAERPTFETAALEAEPPASEPVGVEGRERVESDATDESDQTRQARLDQLRVEDEEQEQADFAPLALTVNCIPDPGSGPSKEIAMTVINRTNQRLLLYYYYDGKLSNRPTEVLPNKSVESQSAHTIKWRVTSTDDSTSHEWTLDEAQGHKQQFIIETPGGIERPGSAGGPGLMKQGECRP